MKMYRFTTKIYLFAMNTLRETDPHTRMHCMKHGATHLEYKHYLVMFTIKKGEIH